MWLQCGIVRSKRFTYSYFALIDRFSFVRQSKCFTWSFDMIDLESLERGYRLLLFCWYIGGNIYVLKQTLSLRVCWRLYRGLAIYGSRLEICCIRLYSNYSEGKFVQRIAYGALSLCIFFFFFLNTTDIYYKVQYHVSLDGFKYYRCGFFVCSTWGKPFQVVLS